MSNDQHEENKLKRTAAFHAQDEGKLLRKIGDYIGAAFKYRYAAELWRDLGETDQWEKCLSLAEDLEKQ